jgi:hypothetical protein
MTAVDGMARDEPITYEELPAKYKQRYDEIKAQFKADLIGSFKRTRHHGVKWKGFLLEGCDSSYICNARHIFC